MPMACGNEPASILSPQVKEKSSIAVHARNAILRHFWEKCHVARDTIRLTHLHAMSFFHLASWCLLATATGRLGHVKRLERAGSWVGACPEGEVPWVGRCEAFSDAQQRAEKFLRENMPPWDVENLGTLELGLLPSSVQLALKARQQFPWAAAVPEELWMDYVLPYASVNENRNDWRQMFWEKLPNLVFNSTFKATGLEEVADIVNKHMWSLFRPDLEIKFKSQQTPLIYDPMSTIAFGFASCTGLSIMYVDALRTVGVPARVVGTPAWHGAPKDGNHNWVEIWLGAGGDESDWVLQEAQPAGPGEKLRQPCDKWFCNPSHFDGKTLSYAAKFNKSGVVYPMAWDLANKHVPGVDRTAFYNEVCGKC